MKYSKTTELTYHIVLNNPVFLVDPSYTFTIIFSLNNEQSLPILDPTVDIKREDS